MLRDLITVIEILSSLNPNLLKLNLILSNIKFLSAPNGTIKILSVTHNTSTTLNLTVGKVELRQENGKVIYYNISLLSNLTGETEFRIASIDRMVIQSGNVDESMPLMIYKQRTCFNNTFQFGRCSLRPHFINKTSYVVNVSIPNLTYWTQYEIKASACTCAGCGPFSDVTYGTTDQYQPTCSTNEITALSTSSTGLNFSWTPLEVNCTHGYATGYAVFFGSAEAFAGATNFSKDWQISTGTNVHKKHYVVTLQENIHFDGLEKFSNYCIAISGSTVKGFGPISNPVCNRTQEDSKKLTFFVLFEIYILLLDLCIHRSVNRKKSEESNSKCSLQDFCMICKEPCIKQLQFSHFSITTGSCFSKL